MCHPLPPFHGVRWRAPPVGAFPFPPPAAATAAVDIAPATQAPAGVPVQASPVSRVRLPPPPAHPPPPGGGGAGGACSAVVVVALSVRRVSVSLVVCSAIRVLIHPALLAGPAVLRCFFAAFRARNSPGARIALHLAGLFRHFTVLLGMRSPPEPFCPLFRVPASAADAAPRAFLSAPGCLHAPESSRHPAEKGTQPTHPRGCWLTGGQRGSSPCGSAYAPPPAAAPRTLKQDFPAPGGAAGGTQPTHPPPCGRSGVRPVAAAPAGLAADHRTSPPSGRHPWIHLPAPYGAA